jgi:DNA replication licensing factor MCM4
MDDDNNRAADWMLSFTPMRPPARSQTPAGTPAVGVGVPMHPPGRAEDMTYIWGTGIAVEEFKVAFQHHLETHRAIQHGRAREGLASYMREFQLMRLRGSNMLEVDMTALSESSPQLYLQTMGHPSECLQMMSTVAEQVFRGLFPDTPEEFTVQISAFRLPQSIALRDLSPMHIETLVAIRGMIVRTSKTIPEVRVAHFECWVCHHTERSVVERGRIFEPARCAHCGKQYSYRMVHNLCIFEDKQLIRLQEAPEHLADGDTPVTISLVVYSSLVDTVVPGDRVVATGIYRSNPMKLNSNTRIVRSIFSTHVDAIHLEKAARGGSSSKKMLGGAAEAVEELDLTDANKIDAFHKIAQRPDIYDILLRSFAPSIWGHDDVKRGILCQMFGGTQKVFRHGTFRSEINIILCGDPGVAKSQLLTHVHELSPRGVYTSGKGSSSVGLTAFVVKDADTNEFVLEPGALVLSDRGICCIDEFDKMNESTRSVLHEVMEQQTMSIAKAGIVAQLNARTSILAAANPKESQWNPMLNIVENLQIEPTLLSRFDLIFLLMDRHDAAQDRYLASHVLALYQERSGERETRVPLLTSAAGEVLLEGTDDKAFMPGIVFSQYLYFAKETCRPALTDAAQGQLSNAYVELRRVRGGGKTVSATLRQLESMLRLSEARCKMRLGSHMSVEDVFEAKRLISAALKDAATDPRTGLINMDIFNAPDPTKNSMEGYMSRLERVVDRRYLSVGKKTASVHELRQALNEAAGGLKPIGVQQFMEVLALMQGGEHVTSFTSTLVSFGSGSGGVVPS